LDETFMKYRAAISAISEAKNKKQTPQDFYKRSTDSKWSKLAVIFDEYENTLHNANALDFDDLLLETVRLLFHDEAIRQAYNRRINYLMIDEYQDTNRPQYELMRLLTQAHKNICVVGDEDQSIYSWRGADIRNILDFEHDYPDVRIIRLEQNYRSTQRILEAAGAVVANNVERKGKTLWTDAGAGAPICVYAGLDAENEALYIADAIERMIAENRSARVAVLYRTNFQSRQIEEALRRYGRKYLVVGGFSYYQRAEVKDALAYLKVALAPQDSISLLRILNTPARGIGKSTEEQIEQYALTYGLSLWSAIGRLIEEGQLPTRAQAALVAFRSVIEDLRRAVAEMPLPQALKFILERTGYLGMLEQDNTPESQARVENLKELMIAAVEAVERGEGAIDFLDHAALVSDSDSLDDRAQVSLMTLHNAKGLEFSVVFLAGLEEGLFPHSRSIDSPALIEEERRLCYVGMTRAEKRLFLTWARSRRRFGSGQEGRSERTLRSRFLDEVPAHLIERYGEPEPTGNVDLTAERHEVRETVKKNTYTGKTYNSLENISQFFAEHGIKAGGLTYPARKATPPVVAPSAKPQPSRKKGSMVDHPKYGRGEIVRREGEGDDVKLTVNFPGYGLKKLMEKYAGLKKD
jgi:DNA helicase II / ATP-dependent DNA helicase PcrA